MKLAVFDIGTNSIHMLVVEVRPDLSFEILDHEKDPTRLGDGSFERGRLERATMRRALEVLDRFHKIANRNQTQRTIAVATSAVREARNSGEFLGAVFKKTGLRVRVISGEEEARLIALGARSSIETRGARSLVIDIGGGSVELVLGDGRVTDFLGSFKLGVARLTDRFLHEDPPSRKELRRLEAHVEAELKISAKRLRRSGLRLAIGTAGTMISLAALVSQDRDKRPLQQVNHFEFSRKDLERVHAKLVRTDLKKRMRFPGLDPRRADLIIAGSTLLLTLMRLLRLKRLTISDKGIREGIILDYIERNRKGLKSRPGDRTLSLREKSVRQLARRLEYNEVHAEQVTRLALELFDRTAPLHGLGDKEREILRYASLLHDIGHYVSYRKHHKHSYYLIVNSELDGFGPEELQVIGRIARLHRKPIAAGKAGRKPGKRGKSTVKTLGAILRVADGLDRSYFSVVESIDCRITPGKVILSVRARRDAQLELWQAAARADLFERVFGRSLVVQLDTEKARVKRGSV